jgi:hypothetical protein
MQRFIEKFFNISHDASATLIITLATFVLGYLITAVVFLISKYFERRSNRKIFINNLRSLNKSIKRQQRAFIETIKTLNMANNAFWQNSKVDFYQISVCEEMSYKENFKSFFLGLENQCSFCISRELKRKAYNKVWENLNNIKFWSNHAFNEFYPMLNKFNQHGNNRNNAINQLRQMWEQLFQSVSTEPSRFTPEQLAYLKKLYLIIAAFQKIKNDKRVMPFTTQRSLILPIRILNRKHSTIPNVRELNDKALEASNHYHEMEVLVRHARFQFREYYRAFRVIQKTNEMIIRILD